MKKEVKKEIEATLNLVYLLYLLEVRRSPKKLLV